MAHGGEPFMSILVTGAYGQLGGELCRRLGADAIPLDIDTLDLTDGRAVVERMLGLRPWRSSTAPRTPRWTRPKASRSGAGRSTRGPSNIWSGRAACWIARSCRSAPITSSGRCSASRCGAVARDDPPSPQGVYARTKLEGEQIAARHPKHLIVRTCGLYARPSDSRAVNFVQDHAALAPRGLNCAW